MYQRDLDRPTGAGLPHERWGGCGGRTQEPIVANECVVHETLQATGKTPKALANIHQLSHGFSVQTAATFCVACADVVSHGDPCAHFEAGHGAIPETTPPPPALCESNTKVPKFDGNNTF